MIMKRELIDETTFKELLKSISNFLEENKIDDDHLLDVLITYDYNYLLWSATIYYSEEVKL